MVVVAVVGNTKGPPKCLAGVYHQMFAPQWHTRGKARNRPERGHGVPHASPSWVKQHACAQTEVVGSQGVWGRQAIQWEQMLTLNLRKKGAIWFFMASMLAFIYSRTLTFKIRSPSSFWFF